MNAQITNQDNKTIVAICGRLDTTNAQDFEKQISSLFVGTNPDITIDCAQLDYISSSGLRTFLSLQKSVMARQGTLVLTNMSATILEVFTMTGFTSIFTIK